MGKNTKILYLLLPFVLVGCGSSKTEEIKLQGTREQIVEGVQLFQPDPDLLGVDFHIPKQAPAKRLTSWPQVSSNAANRIPHYPVPERLTQAWRKSVFSSLGKDQALTNAPIVADGKLFVITPKNKVVALDAWSGKTLWKKTLYKDEDDGLEIAGGITFDGDALYATTSAGHLFALDALAGDILWQVNIGAAVRAAPTVDDGRIFVVSHDNRLQAFAAEDGQLLWAHSGIDEGLSILGGAAPAVSQGTVIVAYSSGEVYALSVANGRYLWHEALSAPAAHDPLTNITAITASPVIAEGAVYVANMSGQIMALSLKGGQTIWRHDYSARSTPIVAGNALFILTSQNQILGLHRKTGKIKWVMSLGEKGLEDEDAAVAWYGPILAGGRLMAISTEGYAVSVSPYNGEKHALIELEGGASVNPITANGLLYFLTNSGKVLAFD